jgi:hypothetical protein
MQSIIFKNLLLLSITGEKPAGNITTLFFFRLFFHFSTLGNGRVQQYTPQCKLETIKYV